MAESVLIYYDLDPQELNPHIFNPSSGRPIYEENTDGAYLVREVVEDYVSRRIEAGKPAYLNAIVLAADEYENTDPDASNVKKVCAVCRIPGWDVVPPPQGDGKNGIPTQPGYIYGAEAAPKRKALDFVNFNILFNHTIYFPTTNSGIKLDDLLPGTQGQRNEPNGVESMKAKIVKVTFSDFANRSRPEIIEVTGETQVMAVKVDTGMVTVGTNVGEELARRLPPGAGPDPSPTDSPLPAGREILTWKVDDTSMGITKFKARSVGQAVGRSVPESASLTQLAAALEIDPAVLSAFQARESGGNPSVLVSETWTMRSKIRDIYGDGEKAKQLHEKAEQVFPPRNGKRYYEKGYSGEGRFRGWQKRSVEHFNLVWNNVDPMVAIFMCSWGKHQILGGWIMKPAKPYNLEKYPSGLYQVLNNTPGSWRSEARALAFINYFKSNPLEFSDDCMRYFAVRSLGYKDPTNSAWRDAGSNPWNGRTHYVNNKEQRYTYKNQTSYKNTPIDTWFILQQRYGSSPRPEVRKNLKERALQIRELYRGNT